MSADARLAVPAAVGWALLAVLLAYPALLPWVAGGCWLLAAVALVASPKSPGRARALVVVSMCATVGALMLSSAALAAPGRWPAVLAEAVDTGAVVRGTVSTTQAVHGTGTRFNATLTSATVSGERFAGSVPVLVFGTADGSVGIGSELRVVGTLGTADAAGDVAFLLFLDDAATLERAPPWILRAAGELREGFRSVATALPGDGGDLLPGLAIGDTHAVSEALDSAMKSSSLSHLTAVSGANCAVIVGLVVLGGAAVGLPRGLRVGAALVMLVGFVILVTPEPSVLRAAVMAALVLVAIASGRQARGLPVLAVAVMVLLVVDPWLARNFAFVLSVCATAGLLLLAAPLARLLARWIPLPLALLVAVPSAAQLACQPVLILLTPVIPTYGVVANILAAPAAPVATVLGLAACVLIPVLPPAGTFIAQLAWLPSAWIAAVATFFSTLPGAGLPWPAGGWGVAVAGLVVVLAAVLVLTVGRSVRWRAAASVCLLLIVAVYLGAAGGDQVRRRLSPPPDWLVAACDVGQGDAMLVRNSERIMLIDTGAEPALLEYCLTTLGISHVDLLVLTHFDLDHVGGTPAVVGRVDGVLVGPSAGEDDDRLVQQLADGGAAIAQVARGSTGSVGQLSWRVLWPPPAPARVEPGNEASVVVEFLPSAECSAGCFSGVFLGDLGAEAQRRMLAGSTLTAVDLVKVSHHGSRDQDPRLYEQLHATVGLIGVGADNDYGHPTRQTLDLLGSTGTEVVRTDRSGLALVSVRDGTLHLWTERESAGVGTPE